MFDTKPFIAAQRLFIDNGSEEKASKFEVIESREQHRLNMSLQGSKFLKHFYLYIHIVGEQNYIKVYSLVFSYDSLATNKFTVSPVKKVRYIEDCMNLWTHKFVDFSTSVAQYYKPPSEVFSDENILFSKRDPLRQNSNIVNEASEFGETRRTEFSTYLNYRGHKNMMVEAEFNDAVIIQDKSGRYFRLFLGKECVFEFTLREDIFRHKLLETELCDLVDVIDGVFRIKATDKQTGKSRIVHLDKGMPSITDPFLVTILHIFLSVYDIKIYHTLVRDIIMNCLNLNTVYSNPVTFDTEDARRCNFKDSLSDIHLRLATYFSYLLAIDEESHSSAEQWNDLSYTVYPTLQETFGPNSDLKKPRSPSEEPATFQKAMSGELAWQHLNRASVTDPDLLEAADLFDEIDFEEVVYTKPPSHAKESGVKVVLPKVSLTADMFNQFRIKFLKYLHLLYEDLKLNTLMKEFVDKLGMFLYCYSSFLNTSNVANYIEYYARDNYRLPYEFASIEPLQIIGKIVKHRTKQSNLTNFSSTFEVEEKLFDLEMLEEEPFDLHKHLTSLMSAKGKKKYPALFDRSYFIHCIFYKHFKVKSEDHMFKVFKRSYNGSESLVESALTSVPVNRVYFYRDEKSVMEVRANNLISRIDLRSKYPKGNDEIYLFMIDNRFRRSELDTFGEGIRTILENILRDIRNNLPSYIFNPALLKGAYTLISREDIYMNIILYPKVKPIRASTSYMNPSIDRNTSAISDRPSMDIHSVNVSHIGEPGVRQTDSRRLNAVKFVNPAKNDDLVSNEIARMLSTSDMIRVKAKYIETHAEDPERFEYEAEAQVLLRKFAIRRMSVLVGKGAVQINTDRSLFTEVLSIPQINLTALLESSNRKLSLEKKEESMNWPEFHSGVSVGLKIPRDIVEQKNKDTLRTWIDYQKTNYESYDKPGLIYALGLQGLLYCFLPTDIYLYLKPFYEPRSIGIMLGLAASKLGSRDENIMKAAAVHLACMLPENTDLQLAMNVECAALVSIGLLYKGTCNKQFSQIMLREILAKPSKEKNFERER